MKKLTIAVMLLASLCWAYPISTAAQLKPKTQTEIKREQLIEPSNERSTVQSTPAPRSIAQLVQQPPVGGRKQISPERYSGRHSTRAEKQISVERLQQWLSDRGSPLAPYASQILASSYYSTIIGICTIEQYGCTKAPYNNYWGIGPGKKYASIPEGISAISAFLEKADAGGRDTVEELNCWYVQPCSSNWLNVVLKTKLELESLN